MSCGIAWTASVSSLAGTSRLSKTTKAHFVLPPDVEMWEHLGKLAIPELHLWRIASRPPLLLNTAMPKRSIRKNDGFLRFKPYRAIVASPLVTQRERTFWSIFKTLLAVVAVMLVVVGAIYLLRLSWLWLMNRPRHELVGILFASEQTTISEGWATMNAILLAQSSGSWGGYVAGFGIFGLLIAGLLTLFWLWMLIDSLTNASLDSTQKIIWALVIFFFPFLGAVIYFFLARKPRARAI
jgi:hypothetical protein